MAAQQHYANMIHRVRHQVDFFLPQILCLSNICNYLLYQQLFQAFMNPMNTSSQSLNNESCDSLH